MKAIRYNTVKREDRAFNQTGREKNPNNFKFYSSNEDYASKYRYILDEDGDLVYECERQEIDVDMDELFNMNEGFENLSVYKNHVQAIIKSMNEQCPWYDISNEEASIAKSLMLEEFQTLSDFENQDQLLKDLEGYKGYYTTNEIVLF